MSSQRGGSSQQRSSDAAARGSRSGTGAVNSTIVGAPGAGGALESAGRQDAVAKKAPVNRQNKSTNIESLGATPAPGPLDSQNRPANGTTPDSAQSDIGRANETREYVTMSGKNYEIEEDLCPGGHNRLYHVKDADGKDFVVKEVTAVSLGIQRGSSKWGIDFGILQEAAALAKTESHPNFTR
jgi:hypothetical protein